MGAFDLVICGERATDGDTGQVGPGLAACLDLPVATYVAQIDQDEPSYLNVRRLVEDGYEMLKVQLPAVITVVKEVADPRLPTLQGKRKARAMEIPIWAPHELHLESDNLGLKGSPTRVIKIFRPKVRRECERLIASDEASLQQAAHRLVEFLKQKNLL
jgi:electron transfer flavoprotein beta subunit